MSDMAIEDITNNLVSPQEMIRLVEKILVKNSRIKIIQAQSLPVISLIDESSNDDSGDNPTDDDLDGTEQAAFLFKHRIQLTFSGKYFDIMDYLRQLENLQWNVLWENVRVQTINYPVSEVTVDFYTLSFDPALIRI